jgi:hypothetical protein
LTSVAAEVSLPTRFQATQQINYLQRIQYDNRHREPTVSALMLGHTPAAQVLRPEWVFGISYVQEATLQRSASAPLSGPFGPFGPATAIERDTWALTGGVNLAEPLSGRLQFVEQIRLHWVDRADFDNRSDYNSAFLSLSPLVSEQESGSACCFDGDALKRRRICSSSRSELRMMAGLKACTTFSAAVHRPRP